MNNSEKSTMQVKYFFSCAIVVIMLLCNRGVIAQDLIPDSKERSALMALYNSTEGDSLWIKKWRVSQINGWPDSTLTGVVRTNGDITEISLTYNNLTGTLPPELNRLTALQNLFLSGNKLKGTIPTLDSLTNLQMLTIRGHRFTGTFPSWLGKLTQLRLIDLNGDPSNAHTLSGVLDPTICNLSQLYSLSLAYNNLSAPNAIPNCFSELDNLITIELTDCMLTAASVDSGLNGLNRLYSIYLNNNPNFVNSLGQFPDCLANLPQLKQIFLEQNGFNEFPASFSNLTSLNYIDLSNTTGYSSETRLNSTIQELKQMPGLQYLVLSNSNIHSLPTDFADLGVEYLYLNGNAIYDSELCNELGGMPDLTYLYLNSSRLTSLPSGLANSESLRNLYVNSNNLDTLDVLKNIPDLKVLEMQANGFQQLPEWFGTGKMNTIETLDLSSNGLATLPGNFVKLASLENLNINNNILDGTWPAHFDSLSQIQILKLANNRITALPDLTNLKFLSEVYLQINQLKGTVPAYLSDKTSDKKVINISYNQYSKIDTASHFNTTIPSVYINNNNFTFIDVLDFKPEQFSAYVYSPQPQVDTLKNIFSYPGSSFILTAGIDTTLVPRARYQWFKYVNGVNDSALFSAPNENAYKYTVSTTHVSDEGKKYYYKITHPDAPNLTLTSKLQTLVFSCKGLVTSAGFAAQRYLCAMNFTPNVKYTAQCKSLSFQWDFGDGTSSTEQDAWHAYNNEGTYTVKMNVHFTCGPCQSDSTLTRQVTYNLPDVFLRDSLVSVDTDQRNNVLSVAATTFSDAWPLQHPSETAELNSFLSGTQGVWRNDGSYVYDVKRPRSESVNISKDGTFTLEQFDWQKAELDAIPNWTNSNNITLYSPYSYELENKDVLGIYSSALYDYGGHLASATGSNMRNDEMGFTGFEFLDGKTTGNLIFGNQPLPDYFTYDVRSAKGHIAVVEASVNQLSNVQKVDVSSRNIRIGLKQRRSNYLQNDPLLCVQPHPEVQNWSLIVLQRSPTKGLWSGKIKVKNDVQPEINPNIDTTYAHTGRNSLKITSKTTFEQQLLKLDSGKTYFLNGWVSIHNSHTSTPKLADRLGINVAFKDKNGNIVDSVSLSPDGPVIEGWQQVRGSFVCPIKLSLVQLTFKPGSTGTAWYDDVRIHPEKGNMKSYVYNLNDYHLRAVLDEENFATLYYYDDEGSLYLVKKETERGIKTISENVNYQVKNTSQN